MTYCMSSHKWDVKLNILIHPLSLYVTSVLDLANNILFLTKCCVC